jgi:hypothetical protein
MREYGQVQCSFWADSDIQSLSDQGKLLAAYLLTGPHSNGIGCYRLPYGYVQADFGWDAETVSKGFAELFEIGFCKRCESTDFVLIPKFIKWNPVANPNVAKSRQKEFEAIPKKASIYNELSHCLLAFGNHWANGFETLLKGYAEQDPDPTRNQTRPGKDPTRKNAPHDQSRAAAATPPDPIVESIPLNDSSEHGITQSQLAEYARLYPAVDVVQQLRHMRGWCDANPAKRKTRRGVANFITRWLAREQDRGRGPPEARHGANGARSQFPDGTRGQAYSRNQAAAEQATRELQEEFARERH